jgi:hypothetical protein
MIGTRKDEIPRRISAGSGSECSLVATMLMMNPNTWRNMIGKKINGRNVKIPKTIF